MRGSMKPATSLIPKTSYSANFAENLQVLSTTTISNEVIEIKEHLTEWSKCIKELLKFEICLQIEKCNHWEYMNNFFFPI